MIPTHRKPRTTPVRNRVSPVRARPAQIVVRVRPNQLLMRAITFAILKRDRTPLSFQVLECADPRRQLFGFPMGDVASQKNRAAYGAGPRHPSPMHNLDSRNLPSPLPPWCVCRRVASKGTPVLRFTVATTFGEPAGSTWPARPAAQRQDQAPMMRESRWASRFRACTCHSGS